MHRDDTTRVAVPVWHCVAALLFFVSLNAPAAIHQDTSVIKSGSTNNLSGAIGINMAAGDNNIQANTKSIAIGNNAQAITKNKMQTSHQQLQSSTSISSVRIDSDTLNNATGLVSINQASGSGNLQLNDIGIALGENAIVISDALLMNNSTTLNSGSLDSNLAKNTVHLSKNSMKNASGVIQINQIAGHGNTVMNRVSMPIQ